MSVEGRRTIAGIVVLLLAAGGLGVSVLLEQSDPSPERAPLPSHGATLTQITPPPVIAADPTLPREEPVAQEVAAEVAPAQEVERDVAERDVAERDVADRDVADRDVAERDVAERDTAASSEATPPDAIVTKREEPATDAPLAEIASLPEPVTLAVEGPAEERPIVESPAADSLAVEAPAVEDAPDAVFDIVRVEPGGDSVIAGRARAGDTVELLRNGERHDIVVADASGAFAFVPPPLPPGAHEIVLLVRGADDVPRRSRQSVTVVISEDLSQAPVVALVEPDAPTRILSLPAPAPVSEPVLDPAPPADVAEQDDVIEARPPTQVARADADAPLATDRAGIRIASVEAETGGGLYVSADGAPSASLRLYLNETFVARASSDEQGAVSFAIRRGIQPGVYRVRIDEVDSVAGDVLSRAEVEFEVPAVVSDAQEPVAPPAPVSDAVLEEDTAIAEAAVGADGSAIADRPLEAGSVGERAVGDVAAAERAEPADEVAAAAAPEPDEPDEPAREATVVVSEVGTAVVSRGDSLWRISRRVYGAGVRFTVIFDANAEQIRNPDLIYPGQLFVLPPLAEPDEAEGEAP